MLESVSYKFDACTCKPFAGLQIIRKLEAVYILRLCGLLGFGFKLLKLLYNLV